LRHAGIDVKSRQGQEKVDKGWKKQTRAGKSRQGQEKVDRGRKK
jgi:hypothetical protein